MIPGNEVDCDAINLGGRIVLLNDAQVIPITNMLDDCGDETDDPDEAVEIVAGPTFDVYWLRMSVGDFIQRQAH